MGGNVVRLGALFAGPLLACLLWRRRPLGPRRARAARCCTGSGTPRCATASAPHGDPSIAGLLLPRRCSTFLDAHAGGGPSASRSRSPPTTGRRARVAPHYPLARGWERQLDREVQRALLRRATLDPARTGAGSTTTPCATSRCPTRRWTTRPRRRPSSCATAPAVPARGLAQRATGACSRSSDRRAAGRRRDRDATGRRLDRPASRRTPGPSGCACASRPTGRWRRGDGCVRSDADDWTTLRPAPAAGDVRARDALLAARVSVLRADARLYGLSRLD